MNDETTIASAGGSATTISATPAESHEVIADLKRRFAEQEVLVKEREKEVEERTRALLDALYDAKKYLLILEQADLIVMLVDGASQKFVYLNKRCEEVFGFSREEVLRKKTPETFGLRALERRKELFGGEFKKSIDRFEPFRAIYAYTSKKGREGVLRLSATRFEEEGGGALYVLLGEDITAHRARERLERRRTEETERLNQLMVGRELRMIALKEEIRRLQQGIMINTSE